MLKDVRQVKTSDSKNEQMLKFICFLEKESGRSLLY